MKLASNNSVSVTTTTVYSTQTWYYASALALPDDTEEIGDDWTKVDGVAADGSLTVESLGKDMCGGYYLCIFNNGDEFAVSEPIKVEVPIKRFFVATTGNDANSGAAWGAEFKSIQKAIDEAYKTAADGDSSEVWIKCGTYKEGKSITMKNNVEIYGGFAENEKTIEARVKANQTIINGEHAYRVFDNDYLNQLPLTNSAKLDRVSIVNGNCRNIGAGMLNYWASSIITNCIFSFNSCESDGAVNEGGGMAILSSSPTITNCIFSSNSASYGGGMTNIDASVTIRNCILWNNVAKYYPDILYITYDDTIIIRNSIIKGGYKPYEPLKGAVDGELVEDVSGVIDADPKLRDFENYSGTYGVSVGVGSPAIGAGVLTDEDIALMSTDVMGAPRTAGACTIGAVEYNPNLVGVSLAEDNLASDDSETPSDSSGGGSGTSAEGGVAEQFVPRTGGVFASDYEFTLKANVTSPVASYQWFKNGAPIEGATGATFKTAQSENLAEYSVKVDWGGFQKTSVAKEVETSPNVAFFAWASVNLASLPDGQKSADAVPFDDGITNVERYAFGLPASAPTTFASCGSFKISAGKFAYRVNALASDLTVAPLYSFDLINWHSLTPTEASSDGQFIYFNAEQTPTADNPNVFYKLQVDKK